MTPRQRLVILFAAAGWAVAVTGGLVALAMLVVGGLPHVETTFGLGAGGMVGFVVLGISWATVGALLVARRPDNVIGRYMIVVGAGYSLSILTGIVTFDAIAANDVALARAAGWLTVLTSSIGELTLYIALIFPTGRGHTPRWDLVSRACLVGLLATLGWLLVQPGPLHLFPGVDNPVGFGPDVRPLVGPQPALAVLGMGVLAAIVVSASVVSRYRAADHTQRLQLKWVLSAIVLSLVALIATGIAGARGGPAPEAPIALYSVTGSLIAVAVGIAILRHHLYDIDRLISRTLSWAVVTGVLLAVFVGVLVLLEAVLARFIQGQTIAVAASTLIAFALFQPVRRRAQAAIDRRFDRAGYDTQRMAEHFGERLRDQVAIEAVAADLRATVDATLKPVAQGLWLRGAGQ